MEISAIIVDDEPASREVLKHLLGDFPVINVIGEAADADSAYRMINELCPSLVFLDIQMPRGSGFTLLKRFSAVPFDVIFVTSFDQYAINAIRFNALDYLLKPVETDELALAIERATDRYENRTNNQLQYVNLIHNLRPETAEKTMLVHAGDKVRVIKSDEIMVIRADGRYCHLTMTNKSQLTTARHLGDFEDYLGSQSSFIRIDKGTIINASHIKDYTKGSLCIIRLTNNEIFEVSRRKKQDILDRLRSA